MRLRLLIVVATLPLVLWAGVPLLAQGESLGAKIERQRGQVERKRAKEGVLSSDVTRYTGRINSLQGEIGGLETKRVSLQTDLDAKLARLEAVRGELRTERARLTRLRARLAEARVTLSRRLVDLYKADSPDILAVVLNADGFADLLERGEFARRIGEQDKRVITVVREAKAEAIATERKLARLEQEATRVAAEIQERRDAVVRVQDGLKSREVMFQRVRGEKRTLLASVKVDRHAAEEDLAKLEREQAKVQARLAGFGGGGGAVRQGSGDLVWPVNASISSGFGYRWGRLHAGIDLPVPEGTAVHAAAAGTVRIAGFVGGYGNYVCIQHEGALSTCYGHNSRLAVSVGQQVSQGQVIAASGNTGHSTGPHVHFETRVNGVPRDPMGFM